MEGMTRPAAQGQGQKRPAEDTGREQGQGQVLAKRHQAGAPPQAAAARDGKAWRIRCGERAAAIRNPIREIMDTVAGKGNPKLPLLSLAQGDPTAYPHLQPSEAMVEAVVQTATAGSFHGYQPSQGQAACRAALAEVSSVPGRAPLRPEDIFMCIGCSEGLSHCIAALGATGGNMLLPRPGFPLYEVLCAYHGLGCRYYDLLPQRGWEIDLESLRANADEATCAVLLNNPSNPCGAVYSREHLEDVHRLLEELKLPAIADEVYAGMTFGRPFVPSADVQPAVPLLAVCALSKRWLAPGWRLGWVTVHDAGGLLAEAGVPQTLLKLCQVSLGPTALLQAAIPAIIHRTPQDWYTEKLKALEASAKCCARRCRATPGLSLASEPQGAMYLMVRLEAEAEALRDIGSDDIAFASLLLEEESVAVLPGKCFNMPGYFRVVFAAPENVLEEAWDRVEAFCRRRSTYPSPSRA